jgi:CubicO group peptidase (beta-lactamase class C family)
MSDLDDVSAWVPGAAVAVLVGDEVIDTAAGVLIKATGVEATPDSVFQTGSIPEVWTATPAMQLVDEGKLDLDATVATYLPGFVVADERCRPGRLAEVGDLDLARRQEVG